MHLTENRYTLRVAIKLDEVLVTLTTGLTFQLFIYMKGNNDTRITGCLQRYIVIKKYDLGTSVTKTVTLIVTYVRCHCHQSQTEKNSRTHSVLHQPWWYTDHREYGTGLRTQRTSAQFHHLTMRNNDAWGRKKHSAWLMWNDEVCRMDKHGFPPDSEHN